MGTTSARTAALLPGRWEAPSARASGQWITWAGMAAETRSVETLPQARAMLDAFVAIAVPRSVAARATRAVRFAAEYGPWGYCGCGRNHEPLGLFMNARPMPSPAERYQRERLAGVVASAEMLNHLRTLVLAESLGDGLLEDDLPEASWLAWYGDSPDGRRLVRHVLSQAMYEGRRRWIEDLVSSWVTACHATPTVAGLLSGGHGGVTVRGSAGALAVAFLAEASSWLASSGSDAKQGLSRCRAIDADGAEEGCETTFWRKGGIWTSYQAWVGYLCPTCAATKKVRNLRRGT